MTLINGRLLPLVYTFVLAGHVFVESTVWCIISQKVKELSKTALVNGPLLPIVYKLGLIDHGYVAPTV